MSIREVLVQASMVPQWGWVRHNNEMPPYVDFEGHRYLSMKWLASERRTSYAAARTWALRRPEQCIRVRLNPRVPRTWVYCRIDCPDRFAPSFVRDDHEYFRLGELAKRRRVCYSAACGWAHRNPVLCVRIGRAVYARDEGWCPPSPPVYLWKDGVQYFSTAELARRRRVVISAINRWIKKHPHLAFRNGRFWYVRDEEWTSRDPDYTPPPAPGPPAAAVPALRSRAARR